MGNFVAGSYAANTEMLVIEQALAFNIPKTVSLPICITATCSRPHVGEYVTHELASPTGSPDFSHVIDLDNRAFTNKDYANLHATVEAWLKDRKLFDDTE